MGTVMIHKKNHCWVLGLAVLCCAVLGGASSAWAHPHVFVDARIHLVFDEKGLVGFREAWAFDEMFGQFILEDYDTNKNRVFEKEEVAKIKAEAFDNLKKSDYFHVVKLDGKAFKVAWVKDFSVSVEKGRVVYRFLVPCHTALAATPKTIDFSLSDPTIYTDLLFTEDSPIPEGKKELFSVSHVLDDGVQPSGQVLAPTLKITVKRK